MKTKRGLWAGLGIGCGLIAGAVVMAQVSEVRVVESPPPGGNFFSLQKSNYPPLPYNPFPELTLYAVATNTYYYDDRELDYVAMEQQALALRLLQRAARQSLSMDSGVPEPPGEGGGEGGTNDPSGPPAMFLSSTGLCLYPPVFTSSNALSLTITNGEANAQYDLFLTTNLSPYVEGLNLTNWLWLVRGAAGQTNFTVTEVPFPEAYFRLGTMLDSDGDWLTDAFENLVSHTPVGTWSSPDTDEDGLPDAWEVAQGLNPSRGDAGEDPDGDGLTNAEEWRAGSDPKSAAAWAVWVASPGVGSVIP